MKKLYDKFINSGKVRIFLASLMLLTTSVRFDAQFLDWQLDRAHNVKALTIDEPIRIMTYNLGGGCFDAEYYQTSGQMAIDADNLMPASPARVRTNVINMMQKMNNEDPDIILTQEVTQNFPKTPSVNIFRMLGESMPYRIRFADNFNFLDFASKGNATLYRHTSYHYHIRSPHQREGFINNTFTGNQSTLVSRFPIADEEFDLLTKNVHLPAFAINIDIKYKDLSELLRRSVIEYERGNFIVIGGDINTPLNIIREETGVNHFICFLDEDVQELFFGENPWRVYAPDHPTARSLFMPAYADDAVWSTIDGFIVSPNVEVLEVRTVLNEDGLPDFTASDHAPVVIDIRLNPTRIRTP